MQGYTTSQSIDFTEKLSSESIDKLNDSLREIRLDNSKNVNTEITLNKELVSTFTKGFSVSYGDSGDKLHLDDGFTKIANATNGNLQFTFKGKDDVTYTLTVDPDVMVDGYIS